MILCIGEILADLIGKKENGIMTYYRYPGGAPLNVACGISNLGGNVGFVGSVGDDIIGNYLLDFCKNINFNYLDVYKDNKHNTTLAFVDNDEFGERSFSFNRFNTADYYIDINRLDVIKDADIIHIGSLMLREDVGFKLAIDIINIAKKYNKKISFDVNYRDDIYDSKELAISRYQKIIENSDIVKLSEDEVTYFSGESDYILGLKKIIRKDQMCFVTLGSKGSLFMYQDDILSVPTFKVDPVDTTGAGDAFYSCVLYYLDNMESYSLDYIHDTLLHANICGGLACTKLGAISALPSYSELENKYNELLKSYILK